MSHINKAKIFIADDHLILLKALEEIFSAAGYQIIGKATNLTDVLDRCRTLVPDVISLDLSMPSGTTPDLNALDTIRQLLKDCPSIKVVVYSMHTSLTSIASAYRAGAKAYVTKGSEMQELLVAVETVLQGKKYLMPHIANDLAIHMTEPDKDPRDMLSKQDLSIFLMLAHGKSYAEIAQKIGVSERYVINRSSVIRKIIGCTSAELPTVAMHYILFDPINDTANGRP